MTWPPAGRDEKVWVGVPAKVMAEYMEGSHRITEGMSNLLRCAAFYEIGSKGLVHTLFGIPRLKEEATTLT
jgi:hypothetical protein